MNIWDIITRNAKRWRALPADRQAASCFNHNPGQPTFNIRDQIAKNAAACEAKLAAGQHVPELRSRDSIKEAEREDAR